MDRMVPDGGRRESAHGTPEWVVPFPVPVNFPSCRVCLASVGALGERMNEGSSYLVLTYLVVDSASDGAFPDYRVRKRQFEIREHGEMLGLSLISWFFHCFRVFLFNPIDLGSSRLRLLTGTGMLILWYMTAGCGASFVTLHLVSHWIVIPN